MNKEMWLDLSNAVRGRMANALILTTNRMQSVQSSQNSDEALKAEIDQLEADMNRLWQATKFVQADNFEEAYNVLGEIGKIPEGTVQPDTEAPTETPTESTSPASSEA